MREKKILIVVPPQGFNDQQYETCRRYWEGRGHKVSVASLECGGARGEAGTAIYVDTALKDVKSYKYDAIAFLGGEGARLLFDDETARKLAKDAKYKVVGASNGSVILLALAGALEGKKVTGSPESLSWLSKGGAIYVGDFIQIDDKLITVRDASMSEELASAVAKALEK
jgi:putative intracellular protease/amidase